MEAQVLSAENGVRTFAVVCCAGEEAVEAITSFARDQRMRGATFTAIGACRRATTGYFDPELGDFRRTEFDEQLEVVSLTGNIAVQNGEPVLHAHVVFARCDSSTIGGHLARLEVFPTLEVILTEVPQALRKEADPRTGVALITLDRDIPSLRV